MTTTQIHGLPTPPLGYRLALTGDNLEGFRYWSPSFREWREPDCPKMDGFIYAVPLNDGYEYHETGTTVIQAGDEAFVRPGDWYEMSEALVGQSNRHCLRRPKAKPSPFAKGWNPLKLTDHQVGEGYRLLELGESREGSEYRLEIGDGEWHPANPGGIVTNPTLHHSHACHRVLISPLAPGRNINGLTEEDYRTKAPLPVEEEADLRHVYTVCGVRYRLTVAESEILTSLAERFNVKEGR